MKNLLNTKLSVPKNAIGAGLKPFNATEATVQDSSYASAATDVFTGISDLNILTEMRDRAIYDAQSLSHIPVASSGTGVIFPDAVAAKTIVESSLRVRPTSFKGPKQLDLNSENSEQHFERQINPRGWQEHLEGEWYNGKKNTPFVGFPNPNLFYANTDSIPTHNVQNLTSSQLRDAMRSLAAGDYDHDGYLNNVGSLLKSQAVPDGNVSESARIVVQSDGGGINANPNLLQRIYEEYEQNFQTAKRIQISEAANDPRFSQSSPGVALQAEQNAFRNSLETQFERIHEWTGIPSGYSAPTKMSI